MEGIIAAVISGGLALVGVIITNLTSMNKIRHELKTQQAVTECKLEELTREVRAHNNFAQRMPVVEEQIRVANHRIEDLESFHKHA
jgi:uncharacterized membrane protein YecN with MAPEG domain